MSSIKTVMLLLLLALSVNIAACETTANPTSEGGSQRYGAQGSVSRKGNSGLPRYAYGGGVIFGN